MSWCILPPAAKSHRRPWDLSTVDRRARDASMSARDFCWSHSARIAFQTWALSGATEICEPAPFCLAGDLFLDGIPVAKWHRYKLPDNTLLDGLAHFRFDTSPRSVLRGAREQRPTARSQHPTEQTPPRWIAQGGRSPCAARFAQLLAGPGASAAAKWPQRRRELFHNQKLASNQ